MTSAYARTDSGGGGGGGKSQGNPTGSGECHLFLTGNRAVLLGNRVFLGGKSHDHCRFRKRGFFKSLSLFSKTIVRLYCSFKLEKKTFSIYKWKEKVQKNTGRRRKLQVTKAAFKGPHRFVFFAAESLPCFETQAVSEVFKVFKVHDFEYLLWSTKLHFEIEI